MFLRLLFITVVVVITSCSQTGGEHGVGARPVVVAVLKGPSGMGMIRLLEQDGAVAGRLDIRILDEPMQVRALMLRQQVQLAIVPTNMAALLYNKGVPYKLAAVPVWGTLYVLSDREQGQRWFDLRNERVFIMGRGMTPDILFRFLAQQNGLNPDHDLEPDYSFPTHIELANAMAAGKAGTGVISEPMVSLILSKNPDINILFDLNKEWTKVMSNGIPMTQTALVVHERFAASQPELLDTILDAWRQSTEWVNQHPREAGRLMAHHGILTDTSLASASIARAHLRFEYADSIKAGILQFLKVFYDFDPNTIGGRLPDENFFY